MRSPVLLRLLSWLAGALLCVVGCSSYQGSARVVDAKTVAQDPRWEKVTLAGVRQNHSKDCGAAALSSVLGHWGKPRPVQAIDEDLRSASGVGLRAGDLRDYARSAGLSAFLFFGTLADLRYELSQGRPVVVGLLKPRTQGEAFSHYEVVVGYNASRRQVLTWDPAEGYVVNSERGFDAEWQGSGRVTLVIFDEGRASNILVSSSGRRAQ